MNYMKFCARAIWVIMYRSSAPVALPHRQHLRAAALSIACALSSLSLSNARADDLAEIPAERYRVTVRHFSPELIGHAEAPLISTNGPVALVNDHRHLWWLDAATLKLRPVEPAIAADTTTWYGPACAYADGFVVAVSDYPEPQKDKEAETPRGGFRIGPAPKGLLIVGHSGRHRRLPSLAVRSHPPVPSYSSGKPEDALVVLPPTVFNDHIQSCAWQGDTLVLGAYGALGTADIELATIDLVQNDYGLEFNRTPLWIDTTGIWFGIDEGGLGGSELEHLPSSGEARHYSIGTQEEGNIVAITALVRHRGRMVVGTTHGLFWLDEKGGTFRRFDFDRPYSAEMVTDLVSHQGFLWSFQGGQWLRIDTRKRNAVRYAPSTPTKFETGRPFGKGWLLSGEHEVWAYRVR